MEKKAMTIGIIGHANHGNSVLTRAMINALKTSQTEIIDHKPLEIVIIDSEGMKVPESNIDRFGALDDLMIQKRVPEKEIDRAVPMPRPYGRYGKRNKH